MNVFCTDFLISFCVDVVFNDEFVGVAVVVELVVDNDDKDESEFDPKL